MIKTYRVRFKKKSHRVLRLCATGECLICNPVFVCVSLIQPFSSAEPKYRCWADMRAKTILNGYSLCFALRILVSGSRKQNVESRFHSRTEILKRIHLCISSITFPVNRRCGRTHENSEQLMKHWLNVESIQIFSRKLLCNGGNWKLVHAYNIFWSIHISWYICNLHCVFLKLRTHIVW